MAGAEGAPTAAAAIPPSMTIEAPALWSRQAHNAPRQALARAPLPRLCGTAVRGGGGIIVVIPGVGRRQHAVVDEHHDEEQRHMAAPAPDSHAWARRWEVPPWRG